MAKVFISHSSKDRTVAVRVAEDLRSDGHDVWLDEWAIKVGECIATKIQEGISGTDFLILLLSQHAVTSKWVEREWKTAFWDEINRNEIVVLPIRIEQCVVPALLQTKKYADLCDSYENGIAQTREAIAHLSRQRSRRNFFHAVPTVRQELAADSREEALHRHEHWDKFGQAVNALQRWVSIGVQESNSLVYLKEYGVSVRQLQDQLRELGVYDGPSDDQFSEAVADAIMNFQRLNHLRHIDGVFGPLTYLAMADAVEMRAKTLTSRSVRSGPVAASDAPLTVRARPDRNVEPKDAGERG